MTEKHRLRAGDFSSWLRGTRLARLDDTGADVPCGGCNACCTSSYFVHIGPDETGALARIPPRLLFPAPGRPRGHVLLGYDEAGRCPMYQGEACSIYEHRPLTCRVYDCRVFAAAGIDADRLRISRQARRWVFSYAAEDDRERHAAVRAAARFLQAHPECFPEGATPEIPAHVAILAVEVWDVFLGRNGEAGASVRAMSEAELIPAVTRASQTFEAERDARRHRPAGRGTGA